MARGATARTNRSARRAGQRDKRGVSKAPDATLNSPDPLIADTVETMTAAAISVQADTSRIEEGLIRVVAGDGEPLSDWITLEALTMRASRPLSDLDPEGFQHNVKCACGHSWSEHTGADGPCTHKDGRGVCSCATYAEAAVDGAEFQAVGECECGHMAAAHEDGTGACTADGCDCEQFTQAAASAETAEFAAETADLPAEHQPQDNRPPQAPGPAVPETQQRTNAMLRRWDATIAPEAALTDDGRAFAPGSITWRELPLTLMAMIETSAAGEGHAGAEVAGRIDRIWREGNLLRATGVFDDGDYGQEIARMVGDGTLRGVSVDLAIREFEVGAEGDWFDEDGNWKPAEAAAETDDEEAPDLVDLLFGGEDTIFVVTDAVLGMVTVCPFPAFADASISLQAAAPLRWTFTFQGGFTTTQTIYEGEEAPEPAGTVAEPEEAAEALTAAGAGMVPVAPPVEWFDPPNLEELTPLVVTPDGRVYGHAAAWDTCHIGIPDVCTTAPHSDANYAYFHLGEIECEQGERVACGKITLGTGHADKHLGFREAMSHYDDTGTAVADVICGEDEYGLWVAGSLRPDINSARVRELRAAVPSGDWRNVNGNLELVALLAVNVPGFPVPRHASLLASSGEGDDEHVQVLAMVAAGHVFSPDLFTDEEQEQIAQLVAAALGVDEFAALAARALTAADLRPVDDEFAALAARARAEG